MWAVKKWFNFKVKFGNERKLWNSFLSCVYFFSSFCNAMEPCIATIKIYRFFPISFPKNFIFHSLSQYPASVLLCVSPINIENCKTLIKISFWTFFSLSLSLPHLFIFELHFFSTRRLHCDCIVIKCGKKQDNSHSLITVAMVNASIQFQR